METFKYLFLVQILFVDKLICWQLLPHEIHFGSELHSGTVDNERLINTNDEEHTIWQILDHFDQTNYTLWKQHYSVNDEHYKPGGPAFLIVSTVPWIGKGGWNITLYAKQFGAIVFDLQHRYYSKSQPTNDTGVENLRYLNSQQALADAASFIQEMNFKYKLAKDVRWIAFGGDYTGSLAAWLRLKYPHLVHAAVASGAPLKPTQNFSEYYSFVAERYRNYSEDCVDAIKDAFSQLNTLVQDQSGQQQVKELFNLCVSTPEHEFSYNDVANLNRLFAYWLGYFLVDMFGGDVPCSFMTSQNLGTPIKRLARFIRQYGTAQEICFDYRYDQYLDYIRNVSWTGWNVISGERQLEYQTCTEMVFFQPPDETSQVFGNGYDERFYNQRCIDIFGPKYDSSLRASSILNTITTYGGTNIDVTNVVFVQGSNDPWKLLGVVEDINPTAPAVVINGEFHCSDMFYLDTPEVKAAMKHIATYIATWLEE